MTEKNLENLMLEYWKAWGFRITGSTVTILKDENPAVAENNEVFLRELLDKNGFSDVIIFQTTRFGMGL